MPWALPKKQHGLVNLSFPFFPEGCRFHLEGLENIYGFIESKTKGDHPMSNGSLTERLKSLPIAIFFLITGAVLIILNFTIIPVFGVVLGVIAVLIGIYSLITTRKEKRGKKE
jgi:hypothetical protein